MDAVLEGERPQDQNDGQRQRTPRPPPGRDRHHGDGKHDRPRESGRCGRRGPRERRRFYRDGQIGLGLERGSDLERGMR
ncbi:MAG TPA: hypothetical protein VFE97_30955 [Methylomirabilota bacterium]|nr:hypothetical protein [Methylomirabilota bacterium]